MQQPTRIEPRVLMVGAGTTGRELLRRLVQVWQVSIVDIDPSKLDAIVPPPDAKTVHKTAGDATSRLVLERAGIEKADYVVAVASTDEVNLEVCRLARQEFGKNHIHAAVRNFALRERYRAAGVEFVTPSYAAAVSLEHQILHGMGTSWTAAEARGEIAEVAVLPSSPMIGRSLSSVQSRRWHVAAIYRGSALIVPTGPTRIEAEDRVILVGEREILPSIAQFFRLGEPEFPLEYGSKVVVLTESAGQFEGISRELLFLLQRSRARGVEILFWPHEPEIQANIDRIRRERAIEASTLAVFGNYKDVARKHITNQDCGLVIAPDEKFGVFEGLGFRRTAVSTLMQSADGPVGVLRGTFPYARILLPVTYDAAATPSARLAFDLARIHKATVTAVTVTAPRFVVGAQAIEDQKEALGKVTHLANLYHLPVDQVHREGNPIEEVLKLSVDYNLMILSHGKYRKSSLFNPDVSLHLLRRAAITTIILPV